MTVAVFRCKPQPRKWGSLSPGMSFTPNGGRILVLYPKEVSASWVHTNGTEVLIRRASIGWEEAQ